jgi:hypothetical protein
MGRSVASLCGRIRRPAVGEDVEVDVEALAAFWGRWRLRDFEFAFLLVLVLEIKLCESRFVTNSREPHISRSSGIGRGSRKPKNVKFEGGDMRD